MSLIAKRSEGAYEPMPEGVYMATCYLLADIGEQYNKKYDKWTRKIIIGWEINGETVKDADGNEVPRTIHGFYANSLSEKSKLCGVLENWRGKKFTAEELQGFDLRKIVGTGCQIQIQHWEKSNGDIGDQISGVMALPRGIKADAPSRQIIFDMDTDLDQIEAMPHIVKVMVEKSRQFTAVEPEADKPPFGDEPLFDNEPDFGQEPSEVFPIED